jgi:hypothetical protein
MAKAGAISETSPSPGSSGAGSPKVRNGFGAESTKHTAPQRSSARRSAPSAEALLGNSQRNGQPSSASVEAWLSQLDSCLAEMLAGSRGAEREAIAITRRSYPQFSEDLIWSRIVYLGLTDRQRPPYRRHEWTAEVDEILREEYGRSRACSHDAIDKILAIHPDCSRDAVIRRARALGLTKHRSAPYQVWTPALDHLLLSLQGCRPDAIAKRLGCTKASALGRLRRLGWGAEFFGDFKTKDLVRELRVSEAAVERWIRLGWLRRRKGRITEASLRWLCRNHPEGIPFEALTPEVRNWLTLSLGYQRDAPFRSTKRATA